MIMSVYIPLFDSMVQFSYGSITGRLGQAGTGWDRLGQAGTGWDKLGARLGLLNNGLGWLERIFGLFSLNESVLDEILDTPGSDDYTRILTGVS